MAQTLTHAAPRGGDPDPAVAHRRLWRRLWDLPVAAHLVALGLVLLALVPVVGTSSSFLSDEGAAVIQGRSLADGRGWLVPHPLPELDPDGNNYPLVNSERGTRGFAPLAKHPAYALLVAGADRLGGVTAMVLLSLAGTLVAAGLAAALAARLDPVLARPAVWATGLASPLLFDGFLVMGHTLGAAFAVGAVLAAVVAIGDRRPLVAAAGVPCIAGAVLIRSEALLFAVSLAAVAALMAVRAGRRVPALIVTGGSLLAAVAARAGETAWLGRITGGQPSAVAVPVPVRSPGFVAGRVDGFSMTWLLPDYQGSQPRGLLLLIVAAGLAAAAIASRAAPVRPARVLVPAGMAALAAVVALAVGPVAVVPGLLIAFPLLGAGLLVVRRSLLSDTAAAICLATSGLFALAVIATQYASGGTGEWGGRYFALAIPVVVPAVLLSLYRQGRDLARGVRRGAVVALVVCSTVLAGTAVLSLRSSHRYWDGFTADVRRAQDLAGPGRPVLTTWSAAPRYAWPVFDRSPWLLATRDEVPTLRSALAAHGFDRFVFVTVDIGVDGHLLDGLDVVWRGERGAGGRRILVLETKGAVS